MRITRIACCKPLGELLCVCRTATVAFRFAKCKHMPPASDVVSKGCHPRVAAFKCKQKNISCRKRNTCVSTPMFVRRWRCPACGDINPKQLVRCQRPRCRTAAPQASAAIDNLYDHRPPTTQVHMGDRYVKSRNLIASIFRMLYILN